jgi:hypothetical protein
MERRKVNERALGMRSAGDPTGLSGLSVWIIDEITRRILRS